ncbi:hypothetical protein ACOMHN_011055 [Nucella lapillus]
MATKVGAASEDGKDLDSIITNSFLDLEKIDIDLYRSRHLWKPCGGRAVFGGQVVGQALAAAAYSVASDHHAHSLHCYFLRPGNVKFPILYTVDRTRDGNVYSSRNIKATQEGRAIFTMQASFKTGETDPFHYQLSMPAVPSPDDCYAEAVYFERTFGPSATKRIKERSERYSKEQMDVLRRPVENYFRSEPKPAQRRVWIKTAGHIGDDYKMHQCCAAYMSDKMLLGTSTQPYHSGYTGTYGKFFMTSVDHSIWFHTQFRADEWLLYDIESPVCREGRTYITGRMWTQDGRLVMSVAQEGVLRTRESKPQPDTTSSKSKL